MAQKHPMQDLVLFIVDLASVIGSLFLASFVWLGLSDSDGLDVNLIINKANGYLPMVLISFLFIFVLFSKNSQLMRRKKIEELIIIIKFNAVFLVSVTAALFFSKSDVMMSRGVLLCTGIINTMMSFGIHLLLKEMLKKYSKHKMNAKQILFVTVKEEADRTARRGMTNLKWDEKMVGLVILDEDLQGEEIRGVRVVANMDDMVEYVLRKTIDEVFFNVPRSSKIELREFVDKFEEMGIEVHIVINTLEQFSEYEKRISEVAGYAVVSFSNRFFEWNKLFAKRCMDIFGSLVGILILTILFPFVAIAIFIESPGKIFFTQKRVGYNGRFFNVYKFRSMYPNAEQLKKDLIEQQNADPLMFKMKDDPRITKVGKIIRKTSVDELPQFLNILKGDMSLVGTRPPTVDEFQKYAIHHKRRLSLKPGLTGLWQISGRSDIQDFEEVVHLDVKYIDEWSIGKDIYILLKTVVIVLQGTGAE